jgi:hypothetical protein
MKPHSRYVQNLTIDKIARKGSALLQQWELQRVSSSGVSYHRLVPVAIQLEAVTRRKHGDSLATSYLEAESRLR